MPTPVFEEYRPAADCPCPGCAAHRRAARTLTLRDGGHPGAHGARRVLVLATAAGVALGAGGAAAAAADTPQGRAEADPAGSSAPVRAAAVRSGEVPSGDVRSGEVPAGDVRSGEVRDGEGTPQGRPSALHGTKAGAPGAPGSPAGRPGSTTTDDPSSTAQPTAPSTIRKIDRATIINRAKVWVAAKVPYSMSKYWTDGYRQDCSGFVSMAWNLGSNEWTGSLDAFATRITKNELQPGDMLLFHNPANPSAGSHVTLFGGWTDHTRTYYRAYEQTPPRARVQSTPYAYWNNSAKYVPYRYKGVTGSVVTGEPGRPGPGGSAAYPGRAAFGPGANNAYVTRLGQMLVKRGGARFYAKGPGPRWTDADRRATRAFQLAQGWTGRDADGLPGPTTWRLLTLNQGRDIPPTTGPAKAGAAASTAPAKPGAAGTGGPAKPGVGGASGPARGGGAAGGGVSGGSVALSYPGRGVFRPGQSSPAVTALRRQLLHRGFGKYYTSDPGPRWTEADRRSVEAFQRAQGWRSSEADGYPGPETWRRLFA
ncbi:peptidoglycan-binding protein [Streptomyces sp. NRRL S-87]|uniref:peptidoglycan-binding protein n=1 Tax=Streptomyces sp. NRRL S-87 TaxID=1463920 RepID=UPI0004C16D5F|nr:peptidoglycan-binding protein [Streptomyces sp. NRRL S-87]